MAKHVENANRTPVTIMAEAQARGWSLTGNSKRLFGGTICYEMTNGMWLGYDYRRSHYISYESRQVEQAAVA